MYKVETHNNSREYYNNLKIDKDAIYITSNTSVSNMIKEIAKGENEDRWRIIDIENFIKVIYPKWTSSSNIVKLKNEIRKAILKIRDKVDDNNKLNELMFLEDNISIVVSCFRNFSEIGIKKLSYNSNSIKLELIKEIFNEVVEGMIFKECSKEILDIERGRSFPRLMIDEYLNRLNVDKLEDVREKYFNEEISIKKVYFYNINNLDLKRYMMIKLLSYAGYEVIFRIPYYNKLDIVNKCWDKVYGDLNLFKMVINEDELKPYKKGVKYVDFLQGNTRLSEALEQVSIKNYREVYDYKKVIKGKNVVTLYKDSIKSILDIDELKTKNHCYQNSIGRFFNVLYKCEVEEDNVKLTFNTYREMITSGWIEAMKWNGIKLHSYLIDNSEYFNGVSSVNEIIERIEKLKQFYEVNNVFEEENKERVEKNSTKEFLMNPFRSFKYVNFEKYNITVNYLYEVTLKLKRFLIRGLKNKDGMINVKEHFELLTILFRNTYIVEIYNNGTLIQKKIARKIYALLKNHGKFGEVVHKETLQELFNVYLTLNNINEENVVQEEDFSIDQLEGLLYRDSLLKRNKGTLYIGDMSYKAYKRYIEKFEKYDKVLTTLDLKYIINESFTGKNREVVLEGINLQEKSMEASESYLKFALANLFINYDGKIEFSWIEGLREDDSKSIILKQIEAIYGKAVDEMQFLDKIDFVNENKIESLDIYSYDEKEINRNVNKLPEVAFRDLDFCGDKFLYSSILEGNPTYSVDFHQRLVFSGLISILKNNIEDGYRDIQKFIFPLFPQWKDVIKKNILDCEFSRKGLREYRYFDGINYPKVVDTLYLLKSKYIVTEKNRIRNRYNKGEFNGDRYYKEFISEYIKNEQNNSGVHCRMCPHIYLCKKGEFVIGNK